MILWADGFDHYGTDRTKMDQYGFVGADWAPSTANPRTGTHSMHSTGGGTAAGISSSAVFRRPFPTPKTEIKIGYGFWINRYPSSETGDLGADAVVMASFLVADGRGNVTLTMGTDGSIAAWDYWAWDQGLFFHYGNLLARSNPGVVHTAAWNHFECEYVVHSSNGSIEVRIDGVTVLSLAGFNGDYFNGGAVRQFLLSVGGLNSVSQFDIDDLICSDNVGQNADFLGDMQVFTDFPNADGATQDWAPSTGAVAYAVVDDAAPNENTDYAEADFAGDVMGLKFPALPSNLTEIAAVGFFHRTLKTGPGGSTIKQTVLSNGDSVDGNTIPVTTVYAGYLDIFETDPDTGAPWLRNAVAAAELDVVRVT